MYGQDSASVQKKRKKAVYKVQTCQKSSHFNNDTLHSVKNVFSDQVVSICQYVFGVHIVLNISKIDT